MQFIKGACSDPQPHPPTFFKHMEILVPKVESYLEGFMCEILCAKSVLFRRNQEKTACKLENVVKNVVVVIFTKQLAT